MKLVIEVDLDKAHRDSLTGALDQHEAAKLVEAAAERVRGLDMADLSGCSYRLKNEDGATVGSVTVREGGRG